MKKHKTYVFTLIEVLVNRPNKAVMAKQLPAQSRDDHRNWNLLPAVEGAPPVAGARP